MYNKIKNAILPYLNDSDPMWEEIGSEEVVNLFQSFSKDEWERFIKEIPENDVTDVDARIIDCLTQINSSIAIKAALEISKVCSMGAFDLFFLRLTKQEFSYISKSDLKTIEKRARLNLETYMKDCNFYNIYNKQIKLIQECLND